MDTQKVMCPSARCREGAVLIGVVMSDGRVAYTADRLEITAEFVETAKQGRSPEKRFRFASPCVKNGCSQWTGSRCGVIDKVSEDAAPVLAGAPAADLPECSIRSECRWFMQLGGEACQACPLVITDLLTEAA
jgi:hypothetical protein